MIIVIPGAYNAQTGVPGGNVQGQTITVGAILKVTERDRRPYPSDSGSPSEIWIDNTSAIGYICKENGPTGTVWDRLDLLGDYIAFADGNPGPNADITWGFRPGSLRYARNSQTLWICDDNTQGAAIWSVLGAGALTLQTNGLPNGDQTLLNIVAGTNMTITDDGFGNITFDATGGPGGTYTVNNGLSAQTVPSVNPNNFQLGGNLVKNTTINGVGYTYDMLFKDIRLFRVNSLGKSWIENTTFPGVINSVAVDSQVSNLNVDVNSGTYRAFVSVDGDSTTGSELVRLISKITYPGGSIGFGAYKIEPSAAFLEIRTPNVNAGTATVGQVLALSALTGEVEYINASGNTYTVNNGLTPDPFNINNFQLGGNLIKSTLISAGLTTANNRLQIDAPQNTDTAGSLYVTALNPGGTYTSSNNILANFQSNDIITAFFRTGSSYGGSGTGVYIQSINALCTPIVIYGSGALGSGEIFKVTDNGQLILEEYNSSTSFQGVSGLSQGVLNVDSAGNVFVGTGGGGGGTYTVDNGLTENPTGTDNFQLGSTTSGGAPLLHDTYINTTANHTLYLEGQKTSTNDFILDVDNSTADGGAIRASAVGNGNAIRALSSSGSALAANSTAAPAISATTGGATEAGLFVNSDTGTNNIVQGIKLRHSSSGVPAPGFGVAVDFTGKTTLNSDQRLGRLIYQWTDPVTISRTSKFQLETVNLNAAGIKLEVDGPGQLKLNNYGQTPANFSGTPVWGLGVDLNGNVIEYSPGTGGGDMLKSVYDVDNDGIVDKAERVEIIVRNSTGSTLTKGQIVYLSGATGNRPNAVLANANTEATSSKTIGMVVADISNNSDGNVAVNGTLHDLNTNSFADGDTLWLGTTAGGVVANTPPAEPNHAVFIGYVARAHPTQGRVVLKIQNGYELNELHGVLISSEANNDLLVYETSSTLWKNKSLSTAYPNIVTGSFGVSVDGITSVVQVGQVGYVVMPYAGTITGWSITANTNGNISFDITRASGAIPTVSIITSGFPTLSGINFFTSTTVGGWSTSFAAGDVFGFTVRPTPSIIKNATLTIRVNKT